MFGIGWERRILGRALTLALVIMALAQPELGLRREKERVVFLVDRSASVADSAVPAFWELAKAVADRGAEVGVVVFGGMAVVVRPPGPGLPQNLDAPAVLDPRRTDLGGAVDLGLALLDGGGQLVLISDGRDTEGRGWAAAARARIRGVPIHVFPVGLADPLRLVDFRGPSRAPLGGVELKAKVEATQEIVAKLVLSANGLVEAREIRLSLGLNEERFSLVFAEPGVHRLTLRLEAVGDPLLENNVLEWAVIVGEVPPILVVGEGESAVDALLSGAGLPFRRRSFLSLADLAETDLLILDDYPLGSLGPDSLEAVRAFLVQGGGLLVIQGRRALSGYAGPMEEILPVTYSVPQAVQEATAAIVFVLDRSASMAGRAGPVTKIALLKDATAAAAEWIPDQDWLGAVAFDRTPFWLVFPGPASATKPALYAALGGLTPSGGTDLWPAVELALSALSQVPARLRHIILVSDGKTVREGRNFQALYKAVEESGVGLTALALGPDPDLEILAGLAQAGGGELHVLHDPTGLRAVLVEETKRALRPRFVEGNFSVLPRPAFSELSLPPVSGYALTFPKPTAEVALLSDLGDPILAFGRIGLGQVAVLNLDLRGVWSKSWVESEVLAELFSRVISRIWPEREPVEVHWKKAGQKLQIRLDVAQAGRWVQGLKFSGSLAGPGSAFPLGFQQTGPGRYEAELSWPGGGAYLLSVAEELGRFQRRAVVVLPYPPEFAELGPDVSALAGLAGLTGGAILEDEEIPGLGAERREWVPLWPILVWAGAGSLLVDLVLRKILRPAGEPGPTGRDLSPNA